MGPSGETMTEGGGGVARQEIKYPASLTTGLLVTFLARETAIRSNRARPTLADYVASQFSRTLFRRGN